MRRFVGLPRSVFGTALAHLGLGLTLLGIVSTLALQAEKHHRRCKPGETIEIAGYTLRFDGITRDNGPNYSEDQGHFVAVRRRRHSQLGEIISAKRFYPVRQMPTTEAGIKTLGFSQLYVSLGDYGKDGSVVVRVWWKPLVTLIWLGGLVMMAGAAVSLLDRRLRVGAPARRRAAGRRSRERTPHEHGPQNGARSRCFCRSPWPGRRSPSCPARCCRIRRWRRGPGPCPASFAAWSARTSRSTIPTPTSPMTCACWCANGSRPATMTKK